MTKLSKPLSTRINRLAHRVGQQHEARIKAQMIDRLQHARTAGASFDELNQLLDQIDPFFNHPEELQND